MYVSLSTHNLSNSLLFVVQKNFVQTVRAVEIALGIPVPGIDLSPSPRLGAANNVTSAFAITASLSSICNAEVQQVLADATSIFEKIAIQLKLNTAFAKGSLRRRLSRRTALVTKYVTAFTLKLC
jgi:glucan endo-1,6-beta-glucosidase